VSTGPSSAPRDLAITAIAALDDQLRRRLYEFIRSVRRPVTREEAAVAVGISRKLAAFHLDRLVAAGLLRTDATHRGGVRRVGRTPKAYLPVDADIRVNIPERQHEVLATILIDAVLTERVSETGSQAVLRAARERGEALGAAQREQVRPGRLGAERALTLSESLLTRHGYEPERVSPTRVCLRNCPFHPVSRQFPELVCGLNHAFLTGFLTGLDAPSVHAVLQPRVGECCVELGPASAGAWPGAGVSAPGRARGEVVDGLAAD
jgi:predicted ArsR family transcriptional regulator